MENPFSTKRPTAVRAHAASRATLVGAEEQPAALLNLLLLMPAAALARRLMQEPTHAAQAALVLA